jgi:hypothetical protein
LKANNFLSALVQAFEDNGELTALVEQMISKLQLIAKMHGKVVNVNQTQVKQKKAYVYQEGKQMFLGFKEGETYMKMKKLGKKSLASN